MLPESSLLISWLAGLARLSFDQCTRGPDGFCLRLAHAYSCTASIQWCSSSQGVAWQAMHERMPQTISSSFWQLQAAVAAVGLGTVLLRNALNLENSHKELLALSILVSVAWRNAANITKNCKRFCSTRCCGRKGMRSNPQVPGGLLCKEFRTAGRSLSSGNLQTIT